MSPRAAWRLESLGFDHVYDYVAGKADWAASGLPLERADPTATVGDAADGDVPTCRLDERLPAVRERVAAAGWEMCIVVNEERVVLGRLGGSALVRDDDVSVEEAMAEGPSTVRPDALLAEVTARLRPRGIETALVTTSDGRLVGVARLGEER